MEEPEPVEELEYGDLLIQIVVDELPLDPREFSVVGHIVHWHKRYNFGEDIRDQMEDLANVLAGEPEPHNNLLDKTKEWLRETRDAVVILPLYLLDHGILRLNTSGFASRWDSGQVGFIYATREKVTREYGRIDEGILAAVGRLLRQEVKEFDQFLTGQVYGYRILNPEGELIEDCYGFYGDTDYCKQEALTSAKYIFAGMLDGHAERVKAWIRYRVPLNYRYQFQDRYKARNRRRK